MLNELDERILSLAVAVDCVSQAMDDDDDDAAASTPRPDDNQRPKKKLSKEEVITKPASCSSFLSEYNVTKISSFNDIQQWALSNPNDKHLRVVVDGGGRPVFLSLLLSNINRKSYSRRHEDTQRDIIIQQIKSETERKGHGTRAVQMMLKLADSIGRGIHVQCTHTSGSKALCRKLNFYSDTEGENFFSPRVTVERSGRTMIWSSSMSDIGIYVLVIGDKAIVQQTGDTKLRKNFLYLADEQFGGHDVMKQLMGLKNAIDTIVSKIWSNETLIDVTCLENLRFGKPNDKHADNTANISCCGATILLENVVLKTGNKDFRSFDFDHYPEFPEKPKKKQKN